MKQLEITRFLPDSATPTTTSLESKHLYPFPRDPSERDLGFLTGHLVHCTLPHRKPEGNVFTRKTPWVQVRLHSAFGLPYGPLARLLLAHILTQAVRTQNARVLVARSLSELAGTVGLTNPNGRELTRLKEQVLALMTVTWTVTVETDGQVQVENWQLLCEGGFRLDAKAPEQLEVFDLELVLSDKFFNALRARPVPFDMRALMALRGSPLAMDFYLWANHRAPWLEGPVDVPYRWLMEQFGVGYDPEQKKARSVFQQRLKGPVKKVQAIWPELRVEPVEGALRLYPSAPHVKLLQ